MKVRIKDFIQGDMLLGRWLSSNVLLLLLIALLLIVYIGNRYKIEGTVKNIDSISREIQQLHQKHTQMKTTYQNTSKMLELDKKLAPIGVGVSKEPIKEVIFISK